MNIPGLPEGVECVRIGRATPEDFEIIALVEGHAIRKGIRHDSISQIIVRPAEGWQFQPSSEPFRIGYVAVKVFEHPVEIVVTAKFSVTNSGDQQAVTDAAAALAALPGYVG